MRSATLALALGAAACTGTLLATWRFRRPAELGFVYMMIGWLVGELAMFHLAAQAAVTLLLVAAGAAHDVLGKVGIALFGASMFGLVAAQRRAGTAAAAFERGLAPVVDPAADDRSAPGGEASTSRRFARAWLPFRFDHRGVEVTRGVAYGEHTRRHRLDIYRSPGADRLPVVVYIHGGAWVIGNKEQQGKPLLLQLARSGYVAVTINYRLAPRHRWPIPIIDVKRAIVWVRENIAAYGGDPSFIAVCGSSAGGHLAALAALTPGDPAFQPGFESADTSVDACVPIYAPFDLTDRSGLRGRAALRRFLERLVMTTRLHADQEGWRAASPIWRVNAEAPPMLVIQGELDTLVWREEAGEFAAALRECTRAPLALVVVPGAQHAFEVFNSVRCRAAVDAIVSFLGALAPRTSPIDRDGASGNA